MEIQVDDGDGFYGSRGGLMTARRPGGMGLRLVDALCDHWHAERRPRGRLDTNVVVSACVSLR